MMDIVELSLKMEANLLDGYSSPPKLQKRDDNFTQRLTRSQTTKGQKQLIDENEVIAIPKKTPRKVEVEKIYLDKKTKIARKNLETIYENPIWKKGNTMLLGASKVKRSIYLDREFRITSKQKSKLRKMKIKQLGKRIKPFKISDEEFNRKMMKIESYLNGSDQDIEVKKEDSDVEFNNCNELGELNEEICNENGSENKNFHIKNEFLIE